MVREQDTGAPDAPYPVAHEATLEAVVPAVDSCTSNVTDTVEASGSVAVAVNFGVLSVPKR